MRAQSLSELRLTIVPSAILAVIVISSSLPEPDFGKSVRTPTSTCEGTYETSPKRTYPYK